MVWSEPLDQRAAVQCEWAGLGDQLEILKVLVCRRRRSSSASTWIRMEPPRCLTTWRPLIME